MNRFSNFLAIVLLLPAVAMFAQSTAPADTANAMYEHGVASYFDGNFSRAEMYLNRSLEIRPTDPRAHYFLGLTLLRQDRLAEAEVAIQQGAAVEAASGRSASVGHALEPVQGSERTELERMRKAAQSSTRSIADENARLRQERFERRQQVVLRKPVHLPLEAFIDPVPPDQIAAKLVDRTGPASLADIEEATTEVPAVEDAEVLAAADEGDPFGDDPASATATEASPAPAAGSGVKASRLPGIFGRIFKRQLPSVDTDRIRGMVPGGMVPGLGGGTPPGMPGELGPGGFGPGEFGPGEPGPGAFGPMEPGGDENPFGSDEPSPSGPESPGEDSTPSGDETEENPFGF